MPDTTTRTHKEIAAQIARSVSTNDLSLFREVLAKDAVWWHAIGDRSTTVEESLAYFQMVLDVTSDAAYVDRRVSSTPTGYVDQHYFQATTKDGVNVFIPSVMVVTVVDGMVTRLDEYVEALAAAPIATALEASATA